MEADLREHGFTIVQWGSPAEVQIVNSCAVTGTAVQKSRQLVSSARKRFPESYIVLCGCAAKERELIGDATCAKIDLLLPNPKPVSLAALLPSEPRHVEHPPVEAKVTAPLTDGFTLPTTGFSGERTRANLKIQEGCDFRCTYCIVPDVRGPARSRDSADVLREAKELITAGCHELVLTGVNIATYRDAAGRDLAALCEQILALPGDFRIRLGSTEPGPVLDRIIALMASDSRMCRFLHLPLQYGDDAILRRMGRRYTCEEYAAAALSAAEKIPGVCLGTDLMVGFPGEDDAAFANCLKFVEEMPLGLMHVFSYSRRPNTVAAKWPLPPASAVSCSERVMLDLAGRKARALAASQVGSTVRVLLEGKGAQPHGWSDNYLKVMLPENLSLEPNTFHTCRIIEVLPGVEREVRGEL